MSDEEDIEDNVEGNNDDRFTKVENDVFNIEGYQEPKPEEDKGGAQEVAQVTSNKDKPKNSQKEVKKFQIILLGEKGVGKTSLVERYVKNKFSNFENQGVRDAIHNKKYDVDKNLTVELTIKDTCEVENLQKFPREFFTDAHGAMLVFNLADHRSFERLSYWKEELDSNGPRDIVICYLGNQADRTADRKVTLEEAKNLADDNLYYDVSAKAGNNVSMAFEQLTMGIIEKQKEESNNPDKVLRGKEGRKTMDLKEAKNVPDKKKCC
jgi:small GTP-binding protein